jgi:hypothetical protein
MKSSRIGRSLCFSQLIAQSPPFAHLAAVYRNFDWDIPLRFVHKSAGLSDRVLKGPSRRGRAPPAIDIGMSEFEEVCRGITVAVRLPATNRGVVALGSIGVLRLLHEAAGAKSLSLSRGTEESNPASEKRAPTPAS